MQNWKRRKIVWLGIKVRLWSSFLDRSHLEGLVDSRGSSFVLGPGKAWKNPDIQGHWGERALRSQAVETESYCKKGRIRSSGPCGRLL